MKRVWAIVIFASVGIGLMSCQHEPAAPAKSGTASAPPASEVRQISLPIYQANLPPAPGREVFAVACLSCHSERYISMQPPMIAAKWEESVRKMMKTYAAPVAEDQVAVIVQYVLATKESGMASGWN